VNLRAAGRAVALGVALAGCILHYWRIRLRGALSLEQRARWLQDSSRRILAALHISSRIEGIPPARGIVISNHLSYLDIVIFSAAMPCSFVAKAEISRWPYFGEAARAGGTLFIDRGSRASADRVAAQIADRLAYPVPVLFFPEGTSTDGSAVRRFHSRLFDPATCAGAPVTAAAIRYIRPDNGPERELCWYGDEPFLPHLWRVLGSGSFQAELRFGQPRIYTDRRVAARETQAEVSAMRAGAPVLR
jgi:lyso-ornithine lipid O-acyltransferase